MSLIDMTQIGIIALTGTGIWLIGRPERWSRWGHVLGLSGQPVWLYMSLQNRLWGVTVVTLLCTYGWAQGVWFKCIKAPKDPGSPATERITETTSPPRDFTSVSTGEIVRQKLEAVDP